MPTYQVYFHTGAGAAVTVDAPNADIAVERAWDELPSGLCHHCAREVELDGDWDLDEEEPVLKIND